MINVIGLGYIGLPTALMLASRGIEVIATDCNAELVATLNAGKITFEENGLDTLYQEAINAGIHFTMAYVSADIYIICVPTPYEKENKKIDASSILSALKSIMDVCPKGAIVVIESTVSPGTIDNLRSVIKERSFIIGEDIHIVHAPERILPGNMIHELKYNPRTIGADCPDIGKKIKEVYSSFCEAEISITDIRTAEMTKVVENTYRDINIAFANELAKICRYGNMNVYEIIRIANKHPRVNILQPGPGVGGHCISVDPWFLVGDYPGLANIILAARKINDSMPEFVLLRINEIMKKHNIKNLSRVGLYGLTYKEDVDDVRESPTLQMLDCMERHLAYGVKVYDPFVREDIVDNQYHDFNAFLNNVDIVVIMVAHSHIKSQMDKLMSKLVLDTRNICHFNGVYKL